MGDSSITECFSCFMFECNEDSFTVEALSQTEDKIFGHCCCDILGAKPNCDYNFTWIRHGRRGICCRLFSVLLESS